ncbi:unnamed protein product [Musa hybrid cultivar]
MSLIFRKEKTPAGDLFIVTPSSDLTYEERTHQKSVLFLGTFELLLENKRMFDRSIRDIERKKQGLQAEEQKLIAEMAAVKVMTKDLIRTSIRLQSFMPSNHSSKVYLLEFSLLEHTTRIRLLAAFNEISVAEVMPKSVHMLT